MMLPSQAFDVLPASGPQRGLWLSQQLRSAAKDYVICEAYELRGRIDLDALRGAFDRLLARHSALRTGVCQLDDELVRFTVPPVPGFLRVVSGDPAEVIAAVAAEPFDLARPPLMRAVAVIAGPERTVLVLCFHHVAVDETSIAILCAAIGQYYIAALAGETEVEHEVARQTRPVSREVVLARCAELASAPAVVNLPAGTQDGSVELVVPRAELEPLLAVARDLGVTRCAAMLGAAGVALARLTGQDDLIIALAVSTRDELTADAVGMFVNMVPLRLVNLATADRRELLLQAGFAVLQGLAAAGVPFEELVAALPEVRRPGRMPLAQVSFSYWELESAERDLGLPGVSSSRLPAPAITTEFELALGCVLRPDDVILSAEWKGHAFDGRRGPALIQDVLRTAQRLGGG
ncbi:condensation domain-containing protein [Lentzea alba]|uniref:condensation domain-containing protein n=1 Tax=Lentzea alba TaxID=2714351 RepID=UPI0039BFC739